jgi:hypothetical protein
LNDPVKSKNLVVKLHDIKGILPDNNPGTSLQTRSAFFLVKSWFLDISSS